jgi:hypothetical protein
VGRYGRMKWWGNHAYLYDITERPIRRLTPSEASSQQFLKSLLPRSKVNGQFFRVKHVGPYSYLYQVVERPIRALTEVEIREVQNNPSLLKMLLPSGDFG